MKRAAAGFLAILAATLAVYAPALSGGMLWDDDAHVTRADLRTWEGLGRIWSQLGATQQYYPVLHSAFWLEHRLWGDATPGYHLANVLLHAAAAFLFALALRRLWRGYAEAETPADPRAAAAPWIAAALFALHPLEVESVAWISEQKNTLSAVFYFGAALAFLQWRGRKSAALYAGATGVFALALLTKSVTATLPAGLLVALWWRNGRLAWRDDVRPLAPWFALGIASGLFTAWVERTYIGAAGSAFALGGLERALLAGRVAWFYLGKLVWPADLMFLYPRWQVGAGPAWLAPAAALALVFFVLWRMRGRTRGPLAAGLFFLGTLFPALGFFNVYPFVFSYVADHWQYLAGAGIFALAGYGLAAGVAALPLPLRRAGWAAVALLLTALGLLSFRQSFLYRDAGTLYRDTLARNPGCWLAHLNLGNLLLEDGRTDEAVAHYRESIRLQPDYPSTHFNLGKVLLDRGETDGAIAQFEAVLRINPADAEAHNNLGVALANAGRSAEAAREFQAALRCRADYPQARYNLDLLRRNEGGP